MATLTTNLFRGQGERHHRLDVVAGEWPADIEGTVLVVGPDKRAPDGHWFAEQGLIEKIHLVPDPGGRIRVEHRLVDTPVARLRRRLGPLFRRVQFMELSPFGVTNLANTNLTAIDGRLFVGYDAGRPVELDPETLEFVTMVGTNAEWLQAAPGLYEPLCAVAAHPAPDLDEGALWFVNYSQIAPPGAPKETWLARWRLDGPVERWRVDGMSTFDSIHDIKASANHLVFADLPFVVEPGMFKGDVRTLRNQTHTNLWIVPKEAVAAAPVGGVVHATEVRIPMPTGHLYVDHEEVDGLLRVVLQQIPLADLLLTLERDLPTRDLASGADGPPVDEAYEGLIALAMQPSVVGTYLIDPTTGEVVDAQLAHDDQRAWGGVLPTTDTHRAEARAHQRQLWYANAGFDPELVPQEWWRLYGGATDGLVAPADLPHEPVPGSLARIDLDEAKVAEVWPYEAGAFPSPPTFVPRMGSDEPDDGYVLVVVHRDGPKELQLFDARHLELGPVARATAPDFNPGLLLHSVWMPPTAGGRRSAYRVRWWQDVLGALRGIPGVLAGFVRMGRAVAAQERAARRAR